MTTKYWMCIIVFLLLAIFSGLWVFKKFNFNSERKVGEKLDSLNGVYVYYNGGVDNVVERNTAPDGYNLGLKYQCVEFVKRYYYEHFNHKMPDSYGHAKDFFNSSLLDGQKNTQRNLIQFTNASQTKPKVGDLIVFDSTLLNKYGHVAIISDVTSHSIEIIQQNPGPFGKSRATYKLNKQSGKWLVEDGNVLGWLRKK